MKPEKPKSDGSNKRIANIIGQIKATAAFIKQGIAKEIKLCLVDPISNEVKEVYKFSAKSLASNDDAEMNAVVKQKRLLNLVEGFFRQIDTEMAKFEVCLIFCSIMVSIICFKGKPKKLGLVTMVDFVSGVVPDSVSQDFFKPTDSDIQVTNGMKTKMGELSTDYHRMKVIAITAIENTTLSN